MRYSFKKNDEYSKAVYLNHNGEQIFVCNLYDYEVKHNETMSETVDRQIKEAGYKSREEFWEVKASRLTKGGN